MDRTRANRGSILVVLVVLVVFAVVALAVIDDRLPGLGKVVHAAFDVDAPAHRGTSQQVRGENPRSRSSHSGQACSASR
jgi:hypothetical protein